MRCVGRQAVRGSAWQQKRRSLDGTPIHARPHTESAGALRFDTRALYAALETARAARQLTWRGVAVLSGAGSAAALTRLRAGGRVMFPVVMRVLAWLEAPSARFVRVVSR